MDRAQRARALTSCSKSCSRGCPGRGARIADRQSGPLLLRFGTEQQRMRFLPAIAQGEHYFCIGLSEPGAGSDLAAIRTRARKVDGGWRVDGVKLWTTIADRAHAMIALVRTSGEADARREGLSQLLIDLRSPGVTIRPILDMVGERDSTKFFRCVSGPRTVIGSDGTGGNRHGGIVLEARARRYLSSYHCSSNCGAAGQFLQWKCSGLGGGPRSWDHSPDVLVHRESAGAGERRRRAASSRISAPASTRRAPHGHAILATARERQRAPAARDELLWKTSPSSRFARGSGRFGAGSSRVTWAPMTTPLRFGDARTGVLLAETVEAVSAPGAKETRNAKHVRRAGRCLRTLQRGESGCSSWCRKRWGFGGTWDEALIVSTGGFHAVPLPGPRRFSRAPAYRLQITATPGALALACCVGIRDSARWFGTRRLEAVAPAVPWGNAVEHVLVAIESEAGHRLMLIGKAGIDVAATSCTVAREPVADLTFNGAEVLGLGATDEDPFALSALLRVSLMAGGLSAACSSGAQRASASFGKRSAGFRHSHSPRYGNEAAAVNARRGRVRAAERGAAEFEIEAASCGRIAAWTCTSSRSGSRRHRLHGGVPIASLTRACGLGAPSTEMIVLGRAPGALVAHGGRRIFGRIHSPRSHSCRCRHECSSVRAQGRVVTLR